MSDSSRLPAKFCSKKKHTSYMTLRMYSTNFAFLALLCVSSHTAPSCSLSVIQALISAMVMMEGSSASSPSSADSMSASVGDPSRGGATGTAARARGGGVTTALAGAAARSVRSYHRAPHPFNSGHYTSVLPLPEHTQFRGPNGSVKI